MKEKKSGKPIYKSWWFVLVMAFVAIRVLWPSGDDEGSAGTEEVESDVELIEKEMVEEASAEKERLDSKEKAKVERLAKEEVEKVAAEKKRIDDEKNQPVPVRAKEFIYSVFKSGDDEIDETITALDFDPNEKVLSVTAKGKDGWSEKSIGLGFYEDSTTVYRELSKDERIEEIWLTITFPMQDTFGNVEDEEVMATWLSRETMNEVNWKNFNYKNLLDIVDGVRIYPQFTQ